MIRIKVARDFITTLIYFLKLDLLNKLFLNLLCFLISQIKDSSNNLFRKIKVSFEIL